MAIAAAAPTTRPRTRTRPLAGFALALSIAVVVFGARTLGAAHAQVAAASVVVGQQQRNGASLDIPVDVTNVHDLGAFSFVLSYNADVLSFDKGDVGAFLGSGGRQVLCNDPLVQDQAVRVSCVTLGETPAAGVDGDGRLMVLHFTPRKAGASPLALSRVRLLHPNGTPIVVSGTTDSHYTSSSATSWWRHWWVWAAAAGAGVIVLLLVLALAVRRLRARRPRNEPFVDAQGPAPSNRSS